MVNSSANSRANSPRTPSTMPSTLGRGGERLAMSALFAGAAAIAFAGPEWTEVDELTPPPATPPA